MRRRTGLRRAAARLQRRPQADGERSILRRACRHQPPRRLKRTAATAPTEPRRRPPAQPGRAHDRARPHPPPRRNNRLLPTPTRNRQDRPRGTPMRQTRTRPLLLPPPPRDPNTRLDNIEASETPVEGQEFKPFAAQSRPTANPARDYTKWPEVTSLHPSQPRHSATDRGDSLSLLVVTSEEMERPSRRPTVRSRSPQETMRSGWVRISGCGSELFPCRAGATRSCCTTRRQALVAGRAHPVGQELVPRPPAYGPVRGQVGAGPERAGRLARHPHGQDQPVLAARP